MRRSWPSYPWPPEQAQPAVSFPGRGTVVRLDRLGRSLAELLARATRLKERGIALLSLEERIDTSSAAGELIFHVFGAIAHFERRLIAEPTKDGIAAARARGKHPGRQPADPVKIAAALRAPNKTIFNSIGSAGRIGR